MKYIDGDFNESKDSWKGRILLWSKQGL
jgi:hypothetical protein